VPLSAVLRTVPPASHSLILGIKTLRRMRADARSSGVAVGQAQRKVTKQKRGEAVAPFPPLLLKPGQGQPESMKRPAARRCPAATLAYNSAMRRMATKGPSPSYPISSGDGSVRCGARGQYEIRRALSGAKCLIESSSDWESRLFGHHRLGMVHRYWKRRMKCLWRRMLMSLP
jgi:hypothetical protein